jgi:hypothetical protein
VSGKSLTQFQTLNHEDIGRPSLGVQSRPVFSGRKGLKIHATHSIGLHCIPVEKGQELRRVVQVEAYRHMRGR